MSKELMGDLNQMARGLGQEFGAEMKGAEQDLRFARIERLPKAAIDQVYPDPEQPRGTEAYQVLKGLRAREFRSLLVGENTELESDLEAEAPKAYSLLELTRNILRNGLYQPITVRRRGQGGYEIVFGERRWTAFTLLARAGYADFAEIPILEDDRTWEDGEWLAMQVAEDLHKSHHLLIEVIGSIRRIAETRTDGEVSRFGAKEVAAALSISYKVAQRYLRVAKELSAAELEAIRRGHESVELGALLKLTRWLGEQEGLSGKRRAEAIEHFVMKQPSSKGTSKVLAEVSGGPKKRGPGRPARARYDLNIDALEGVHAHIRVPASKMNAETLGRAEERLERALSEVRDLRRTLFEGQQD